MDVHYPTIDEPATPEYVLAVLRDMHRQQGLCDPEADPNVSLSFESTVAEWRAACDLLDWQRLGRAENQMWGIDRPDAEWRAVLEPAHERRLGGVCELIARHAVRPRVRPARLFGRECGPAGAFLTIRSLLGQAGARAEEIAPSTPVAPYTRRYGGLFLGSISQLAPGALPPVRVRHPIHDAASWGLVTGLLLAAVGTCGWHLLTVAGVLLFAAAYSLMWVAARRLLPASVEFGGLKTFRDLAVAVAEGGPVGGRQPSPGQS